MTVTPNNTEMGYIPFMSDTDSKPGVSTVTLLPVIPNVKYSGSLIFKNVGTAGATGLYWRNGMALGSVNDFPGIELGSSYTLSFTSIPYLIVTASRRDHLKYCGFTLS